ncbi:MAG: RHS domain-containing protein, partial [Deltaproteobacteria bacterium]|nr:RHS domain-containing protein [Deltaproteobacteria bacterium]
QWVMRWEGISPQLGASGETVLAFVHADHLGTPQKMTDESGAVVWSADYMPFGEAEVTVGGMENNIRFPGQYYDQETGLHYNYYRYYDAGIGRYLSSDVLNISQIKIAKQSVLTNLLQQSVGPLNVDHLHSYLVATLFHEHALMTSQLLNPFSYALCHPIIVGDPFGLWGILIGGSSMGIDLSTTIYDSNRGWFPSKEPDIGVSTTLVGAGLQLTFDTPIASSNPPSKDLNVSLGLLSKYTGVTYNTDLSRGSINLGLGLGSPVTFGSSIGNFTEGLGKALERLGGWVLSHSSRPVSSKCSK